MRRVFVVASVMSFAAMGATFAACGGEGLDGPYVGLDVSGPGLRGRLGRRH